MNDNNPAASGAAPVDQREKDFHDWFAANYSGDVVFSDPWWHSEKVLRAARRALASPQVAPAPKPVAVEPSCYWIEKAEQFAMPPKDGGRPLYKDWQPLYDTKAMTEIESAAFLRGRAAGISFAALAIPVQVAPTDEREILRAEQTAAVMPQIGPLLDAWEGLSNDTACLIRAEAPDLMKALAAINRAMEGAAPVAPQDDARDAAASDLPKKLMEIARRDGLTWADRVAIGRAIAALSPAAKPAEE